MYISTNGEYLNREFRLRCFTSAKTGDTNANTSWEIGERNSNGFPIHIKFDIERTDGTYGNTVKISVWNLSKSTINAMLRNNAQLELRAGYGDSMPTIFTGTILLVQTLKDGGDMVTQITCTDNRKTEEGFGVDYTYLRISIGGEVACETIINSITEQTSMSYVVSNIAKKRLQKLYHHGYAFIGQARNALNEVCKAANVKWTVQNGVLYITTSADTTESAVHEINKATGLINIPVRVYNTSVVADIAEEENTEKGSSLVGGLLAGIGAATGNERTQAAQGYVYGYRIQYLLDGSIGINSIIHLTSDEATGYFRVYKLKISGDNYNGDWMCTAEIMAMTETSKRYNERFDFLEG